jgi:hypothetical protein
LSAWLLFWYRQDVEAYEKKVWERLAFASRYGNQPLDVLLHMETRAVYLYCEALGHILRQENKKPR